MADTMTDIETSFQRALRIADETKARKRAAYDTGLQAWRECDWRDEDNTDTIPRPVEQAVFRSLFGQTQRRNLSFMAALGIIRRSSPNDNLRAIHARYGMTLRWLDINRDGRLIAVLVPISDAA
jgi:hypothetical protein